MKENYTGKINKLREKINELQAKRNAQIFKLRAKGDTFVEIGSVFGISPEGIRKIVSKNASKNNQVDKK